MISVWKYHTEVRPLDHVCKGPTHSAKHFQIHLYISDPTLYLFQILNIGNCVLYGDIAATKICSSIERVGGCKIDSDKTKLPPSINGIV